MAIKTNTQLQTMGSGNPDPLSIHDGNITQLEAIFHEIRSGVADTNIAIGDAVYASSSTNVGIAATTSGNTKVAVGIAIEAKTTGQTVRYRAIGILTGLSGLTAGRPVWLTATGTTGNTLTNPAVTSVRDINSDTKYQQVLGVALTSTIMMILIQPPITYAAPPAANYTVGTLPTASAVKTGSFIYVSDETGGATLAFSDGTNWRRVQDRVIVS